MSQSFTDLSRQLEDTLALQNPPLAISFNDESIDGVAAFDEPMPPALPDGRTGRVPAGCVFWMKSIDKTFSTVAEDHANCSVGSVTHGFKTLEEVGDKSDVEAIVGAGWVSPEIFPMIPVVTRKYNQVIYGPLADSPVDPDVVFLRINAKQAMIMSDALPALKFEGKPQCHIVAIAKEQQQIAISVGCMLSRVRTGMSNTEMTCAIPGNQLAEVVQKLKTTCAVDGTVAGYASEDTTRFS